MADVFDDELTDEEKAALAEFEGSDAPASQDDVENLGDDEKPADPAAADPDAAKPAAEETPAAPAADQEDEDKDFAEFLEKTKGKTPEEVARLAFDQEKRAKKAGFESRQNADHLQKIRDAARAAVDAKKAAAADKKTDIEARRKAFEDRLENDPDAALREHNERLLSDEEREAEAEVAAAETEAAVTEAVMFASQYIPELETRAPKMHSFALEMGFSPEEAGGITDGKQLVMLHLAELGGSMIKAGIIDSAGKFLKLPSANDAPTDPRLTAPDQPESIGRKPGTTAGGNKSAEQAMQDLLNLSEDEFDKLSEEELMKITGTN